MIITTRSVVLRSIKYGETSLISTHFTRTYGLQTFMVQGIRASSGKGRSSRAGLLQPGMLLDITAYHKPQSNLQRLKEFAPTVIYKSIHEEVIKNSIALFSVEVLLSLLREEAPMQDLFDFTTEYLVQLDTRRIDEVGNYPVFFILQCSRHLGYYLAGKWSISTPYLNIAEGGFTAEAPIAGTNITTDDAAILAQLMQVSGFDDLGKIVMNGAIRQRLLEWFLQYLHRHTEHMRPVKSLAVLQAILHGV